MCLPVKTLKCIVEFNAIICGLLGLASLIGAIVLTVETNKGDASELFGVDGAFSRGGLLACLYVFGILLIFLGICGFIGGKKKSKCLMMIFDIGLICGFAAFLIVGIVSSVITTNLDNVSQSSCVNEQWSRPYYNLSQAANQTLCSQSCPCVIDSPNYGNISQFVSENQLVVSNNTDGAYEYNQCSNYDNTFENQTYYGFLQLVELQFECSGWCNTGPIYLFNNLTLGPPTESEACYFEVNEWFHSYGVAFSTITLLISSISFLTILATFCLCCHPDERKEGGGYYDRMQYYDQPSN